MTTCGFSREIDETYAMIIGRFKKVESYYLSKGYMNHEVTFEDVDLEDLLESKLVPLFVPILESYPNPYGLKKQMSTIFVAVLCEVAKRGLAQGGILKTLEEYIGYELDRNKYYRIIPEILNEEKIEVVLKTGKKYENAIICESGIPRNMHSVVMRFFSIYWKWFKHIEESVRHKELEIFLLSGDFTDEYIIDKNDFKALKQIFESINRNNVSLKAIKSCIKLEGVFLQLDEYENIITSENVSEVCEFISNQLGYNVLTIVNEQNLKKEVLLYANRVSFSRFENILNNISGHEKIITPTGKAVIRNLISKKDFICGYYKVRNIEYEVTYPIPLGVIELICLEKNVIHNLNGYSVYISEYPFVVEIDNWQQDIRQLCYKDDYFYIYVGKIGAAAIAYIDDIPVNPIKDTKLVAGLRKKWDYDNQCNVLGIHVNDLAFYDANYKMKTITLEVGETALNKRINSHGYVQLQNQWFDITGSEEQIKIQARVEDKILDSKEIVLPETALFGKYTGLRIDKQLDLKIWYGNGTVVFFSKSEVQTCNNITLNYIDDFGDYLVYDGIIDLDKNTFTINEQDFEIKRSTDPYLKLDCEYEYIGEKYIVKNFEEVAVQINKASAQGNQFIVKAVHDDTDRSIFINVDDVRTEKLSNICNLQNDYSGKWEIMLIYEQTVVDRIEFVIIPKLKIINESGVVKKGESILFKIVADSKCFMKDNQWHFDKSVSIDSSKATESILNSEPGIQESIYIDNCDIYYPIVFPINVWEAYIEHNGIKQSYDCIDYKDIDESSIIIETNTKGILHIKANGNDNIVSVGIGRNEFGVKNFFDSFLQINELYVYDYNGSETGFKVLYSPKVTLLHGYDREHGFISFNIKYSGPIGIKIGVEIFENYLRSKRIEIISEDNSSIYRVKIPDDKNQNRQFSIEVDLNGRNKRTIGDLYVEKKIYTQKIELGKYNTVFGLIDNQAETVRLSTNLFDLVGIGGKSYEV